MRRLLALLASVLLILPSLVFASSRYDPRLKFRTLSTPGFDIHFHQGVEADAARLAEIAEEVAATLDATLGRPPGRTQVILVAQSDLSNGWATPLPYNTIELVVAAPSADSLLGNTSDWLRLVFTHEYTHIVHLARSRGWIGGLRRVFGRMPLLFPNLYLPAWQIEGLATFEESAQTGQGRINDGSFRSLVSVAGAASRFERLDRVSGGLVDWPAGHAPYAYGGLFFEYLTERYGQESIRALNDASGSRIPYLGSRAFRSVFKRSLGELWSDFAAATPAAAESLDAERLTRHGFDVFGARFGPDGTLFYAVANPHGFPALLALDAEGSEPREVIRRYLGTRTAVAGKTIVFDQIEIEQQVAFQSDLYLTSVEGGDVRRLTSGARASFPDVAPDGRTIACAIQGNDRRELATIRILSDGRVDGPQIVASEAGVSYASPRWSPDARHIAAERGRGEIVLIDARTRQIVRSLSLPDGRLSTPSWTPDGALLFSAARGRAGFFVHRLDPATGTVQRLEGTGADARSAEMAPDGRSIVFVGYTADGYDLFRTSLDRARWADVDPAAFEWRSTVPVRRPIDAEAPSRASRRYGAWPTLAPRFWTPVVASDGDEVVLGAATSAVDALGRHGYSVQAGWAVSRGRPDWEVAYVYDRWRPSLFVNASDETDPWRGGELRTREVNAGMVVPTRRVRWSQAMLAAFHSSTDQFASETSGGSVSVRRRALRGGWQVNAARGYGYSLGLEEGWRAATTIELARDAFGSDGNAGAATADLRGYIPVWPQHGVLAMRLAGATSWGDERARRLFSASGNGPQPGGLRFGSDAIGLLRGVSDDDIVGEHAATMSADYRVPIRRLDRGIGTLPFFARVVHGAVFLDAASAWDRSFRRAGIHTAIGGEVSLDAVVGYVLPVTFTAGAAWRSHHRGAAIFARIGRAF
jgi:hypothetical protein